MHQRLVQRTKRSISKSLTLASVIGALYAILVAAFPATSVPVIQVRIADVLMPLSVLFGWPAALGLAIGAATGNLVADTFTGLPSSAVGLDVVGGSLANLVAAILAWKIGGTGWRFRGRNISWFLATTTETAVIAIVVGSYLGWLFSIPLPFSIGGILLGSVVAISIGGYSLLRALGTPRVIESLESSGLLAYTGGQEGSRD